MKKVNALLLGLAVLLAFGCGGDEPEPDKTPDENFTTCRIKKKIFGTNEEVYTYDTAGNIILGTNFNSSTQVKFYRVFEYNGLGKVSRDIFINSNGDTVNKAIFRYNLDSLLTRIEAVDQFGNNGIQTYEYDTQKRLINFSILDPTQPNKVREKFLYTYISNNKVLMEGFLYNYNSNSWEKNRDIQTTYDDKKRPYSDNEPYPITIAHNVLSTIYTDYSGGVVTYTGTVTTTYTYNSAGYPIKSTDSDGYIYKYEYDCQ